MAVGLLQVTTPAGLALAAIVRNNEPNRGQLALPGGYLEEGENAAQATARELLEEIGFESAPNQWRLLDSLALTEGADAPPLCRRALA